MIDEGQAFAYFDSVHGPLRPSTNGWYDGVCPYCADLKLAVTFEYNLVKCWKCFPQKIFIIDFMQDIEGVRRFEAYEILESYESKPLDYTYTGHGQVEVSDVILPTGYQSILRGEGVLGDRARNYLTGRGFDLEHLDNIGVGYCNDHAEKKNEDYFGYIIIPFHKNGKLVYYIGRDFTDNFPRYKNPPKEMFGVGKSEFLFNETALHLHDKVYLTEGWADAATMGSNGVSYQGLDLGIFQSSAIIKSPVKEVVVVPDVGAYKHGLIQAKKLFDHIPVKVLDLSAHVKRGKDINEMGARIVTGVEERTERLTWASMYNQLRNG